MIKRKQPSPKERPSTGAAPFVARVLLAVSFTLLSVTAAQADSPTEYHKRIQKAVTALDTLAHSDENETATAYAARDAETIRGVRSLLPPAETIEWNGASLHVDNQWLHQQLDQYAADSTKARYELLTRITERLKALDERITELEQAPTGARNKAEESQRLREILQRSEFARKAKPENAASRLAKRFIQWLTSWLPQPKPMSSSGASTIAWIAQWVVIILALGVLAFVLKLLWQRMASGRGSKRKSKAKARIVLGEHLEPDQSALDLLTEAEALARRGELRAAIRRAYIALLVELGDRKIISLAQHKTNRDYLRAVREVEPLYGNVKQLTDSFELHWYGLAQATENDWVRFRSAYKEALR